MAAEVVFQSPFVYLSIRRHYNMGFLDDIAGGGASEGASSLDELLQDTVKLFENKQQFIQPTTTNPLPQHQTDITGFQAPIKGQYFNIGIYAPGVNLNARHTQGHNGVDLQAPGGTALYPIANGIVTNVGTNSKGGNTVSISYANEISTYYAHMGTVSVHKGDKVTRDTVVGTVGDSGNAQGTAPHLHVEVRKQGQTQDPKNFFDVGKPALKNAQPPMWLSNEAKQQASAFNMSQHQQQRQQAFAKEIRKLEKIANSYLRLTKAL